jgi:hypothetical protein
MSSCSSPLLYGRKAYVESYASSSSSSYSLSEDDEDDKKDDNASNVLSRFWQLSEACANAEEETEAEADQDRDAVVHAVRVASRKHREALFVLADLARRQAEELTRACAPSTIPSVLPTVGIDAAHAHVTRTHADFRCARIAWSRARALAVQGSHAQTTQTTQTAGVSEVAGQKRSRS